MSRDDMLTEFSEGTVTRHYNVPVMADEIVRLRTLLEASVPDSMKLILKTYADLYDAICRADKAERILAALREPSEAAMKAAVMHYSGDLSDAIRAAVAAAEQEVDA